MFFESNELVETQRRHLTRHTSTLVLYNYYEDDPASISNDDGGRLSSGSECDDDDADCDGAAALPNNMTR